MAPREMLKSVGRRVPRIDGTAKVTGAAKYVDDITFPGMIYGRTIRSTVPSGEISKIDYNFNRSGFSIVTYRDIPGTNAIVMIESDQPCLAEREIRHNTEPIALLAHADPEKLYGAEVNISVVPRAAKFDMRKSKKVFKEIIINKGDARAAFAKADFIVEGEYETGHQEQLYIETNGVIAVPENGGVTIYGSLQCPYYVHKTLIPLLALPPEKIRIIQMETGGGFGGKEDYPSVLAGHAALLALKSKRPVKMIYDRAEDMIATTKRHPSIVKHKTAVARDGRLLAMEIDVLFDGGAYSTLSPVVLSRGVLHATGPYRCANINIRGRAVMTNTPPNGAFRGFGAPQTLFAIEVHMERIAEKLGIDSITLRDMNALNAGDETATGQILGEDCSARRVLREAVRASGYYKKKKAFANTNRGIGCSLYFHGSGFTGGGEVKLASRASLELTKTGVRILVASTEIGQGTRTMHAQIVAETLGIPVAKIECATPDTAHVPDSGPTVASRTCMIVGKILQRCAEELKQKLGKRTAAQYYKLFGPLVITKEYEKPEELQWDDSTYRGDAYGAFGYACNIAEVELDKDTLTVRPIRILSVCDIGRAIHPVLARGQIEGGTAQGVAFALAEEVLMKNGVMANAQLTNYMIPTPLDSPEIDVKIIESAYAHGPYGAKGVGEMPIDGPAPAVVNAIRSLGIDIRSIPATPERIQKLLQQ
ncbi:MAG: xanthine dehydrogenase family protein molybdopterin-binding subunit [Planctomycetota bacterium]